MARPLAFWNAVGSALLVHALLVLNAVYYPNLWAFKVAVVDMVNEVRGWDPTAFTPAGTPRVEKKRKARREKTQEDYAYVVPLNVDEHFTVLSSSDDLCRCCPEAFIMEIDTVCGCPKPRSKHFYLARPWLVPPQQQEAISETYRPGDFANDTDTSENEKLVDEVLADMARRKVNEADGDGEGLEMEWLWVNRGNLTRLAEHMKVANTIMNTGLAASNAAGAAAGGVGAAPDYNSLVLKRMFSLNKAFMGWCKAKSEKAVIDQRYKVANTWRQGIMDDFNCDPDEFRDKDSRCLNDNGLNDYLGISIIRPEKKAKEPEFEEPEVEPEDKADPQGANADDAKAAADAGAADPGAAGDPQPDVQLADGEKEPAKEGVDAALPEEDAPAEAARQRALLFNFFQRGQDDAEGLDNGAAGVDLEELDKAEDPDDLAGDGEGEDPDLDLDAFGEGGDNGEGEDALADEQAVQDALAGGEEEGGGGNQPDRIIVIRPNQPDVGGDAGGGGEASEEASEELRAEAVRGRERTQAEREKALNEFAEPAVHPNITFSSPREARDYCLSHEQKEYLKALLKEYAPEVEQRIREEERQAERERKAIQKQLAEQKKRAERRAEREKRDKSAWHSPSSSSHGKKSSDARAPSARREKVNRMDPAGLASRLERGSDSGSSKYHAMKHQRAPSVQSTFEAALLKSSLSSIDLEELNKLKRQMKSSARRHKGAKDNCYSIFYSKMGKVQRRTKSPTDAQGYLNDCFTQVDSLFTKEQAFLQSEFKRRATRGNLPEKLTEKYLSLLLAR